MERRYENELDELRKLVTTAEYRVDPGAVADAIVRRRWSIAITPEPARVYSIAGRRWTRARVTSVAGDGADSRTQALAA